MRFPVLHTKRLILREMQLNDREQFINFMTNKSCTRYLMFSEEQKTREGARRLFDYIHNSYRSNKPILALAMALKDKKQMIGSVGASPLKTSDAYECYYTLFPDMTGHGYATEAAKSLFQFLFRNKKATEIRAYMHTENKASQRVAERLSMKYKGLKKHPVFKKDRLLYVSYPERVTS